MLVRLGYVSIISKRYKERWVVGNKEAKTSDTNKLILDPNMDWGKKGRDVNKPTTKLKYEPFSKQTGRPAYSRREGGSDGTERYGDGYDMDYGDEGDIVDIDPRLTPVEKRVKTATISSRPRWKTETSSKDIYDRGSEDGQNLILSPKEDPAKARTDRHTVDFTKQQPRWATDDLDFDADDDMAFAPTDNAKNVVYDTERGREALQGDISRGSVGVTWSKQKPRNKTIKRNSTTWTRQNRSSIKRNNSVRNWCLQRKSFSPTSSLSHGSNTSWGTWTPSQASTH